MLLWPSLTGTQLSPVAPRSWVLPSGHTQYNRHDRRAKPGEVLQCCVALHTRQYEEKLAGTEEGASHSETGALQVVGTPSPADQHLLPPSDAVESHVDAPSVAALAAAGLYSRPEARSTGRPGVDDKDTDISNLLAEKNEIHKAYMDLRTDATKAALFRCRRLVQQRLREIQDAWRIRKAEEIQEYADRNEMKNIFKAIKAIYIYLKAWWRGQDCIRPRQPPAPYLVSGLLDSVITPGTGGIVGKLLDAGLLTIQEWAILVAYLVTNSHLWLLEVGFFPAATPRANVTTGGLNQVMVSGVVCASTPAMSDSRTSHFPPLKKSYRGGYSNPAARVSPPTLAAWTVCSLLDNPRSNRPERRTALVARELARYKVDIAALSETRFSDQGQLEDVGAGYTFFWSGRPKAERRDVGVAFAIRNDFVGLHDLLFADDCALNSVTDEDMQKSMELFAAGCANFGLTIISSKTVVMHQPPPSAEYNARRINVKSDHLKP
ncbi:unnamed protein product [Schistocephalus solidus]|uniref:Reverse transcriptase domain-containing protein n=1 Tax=Schistocephalus solidus TaxID=70667 RepID=A0A183T2B6_SCHSO|nr:unnamed protein product [Schistocephalus solidus]